MRTAYVLSAASFITFIVVGCGSGNPTTPPTGPPSVPAASAAPVGAQLGYVWLVGDATLRPIQGVPGGSQLGPSSIPAHTYVAAAASFVTQVALLEDKGGALLLQHLDTGAQVKLAGNLPPAARIIFSGSGANAVAYAPGGTAFWAITGLDATPLVQQQKAGGPLVEAAMHDSGAVLLAINAAAGTSISAWTQQADSVQVASLKGFGGMAFIPGTPDALVADGVTGDLVRVSNATTPGTAKAAVVAPGLKQPYALGASADGRWVLVAQTGGLSRLDLSDVSPAIAIACSCSATQISPLSGTGLFRVTEPAAGPTLQVPIWMVDIAAPEPQSYFIPPVVANAGGAR